MTKSLWFKKLLKTCQLSDEIYQSALCGIDLNNSNIISPLYIITMIISKGYDFTSESIFHTIIIDSKAS